MCVCIYIWCVTGVIASARSDVDFVFLFDWFEFALNWEDIYGLDFKRIYLHFKNSARVLRDKIQVIFTLE